MREIKFRAWDAISNIMVYRVGISPGGFPIREGYQWFNPNSTALTIDIMQFTGLLDKHGKEIYEGDIVKLEVFLESERLEIYIDRSYIGQAVIIPSKGVCLKSPIKAIDNEDGKTWYGKYYKNIVSYRSEIIGNIYENPELLNDTIPEA